MLIDKLVEHYKTLNISDPSPEEFRTAALERYEEYREEYPDIEDIGRAFPRENIIKDIIDYYSSDTHKLNRYLAYQKKALKAHAFFKDRKYVCAAPHTSLRFDFGGRITVCCMNLTHNLGVYPSTTPVQAWFGDKIKQLRNALADFDFSKGCMKCANYILIGNAHNTILTAHDRDLSPNIKHDLDRLYPVQLVFQLHNTCNYECIMCGGEYSSSIRKNRDKLPAFLNAYDDNFVQHMRPFVKNAKMSQFLGGEPLLMPINFKIWESIIELNPNMEVNIISNGSIFNDRIKDVLLRLPNAKIHISIDSLTPDIYSYIRRNGNLETVLNNIENFIKIKKLKSLSMCPIVQNVYEIPAIIDFCADRSLGFTINNVDSLLGGNIIGDNFYRDTYETGVIDREPSTGPTTELIKEYRLWTLPDTEKNKIKEFLQSRAYPIQYQDCVSGFINYLMNSSSQLT